MDRADLGALLMPVSDMIVPALAITIYFRAPITEYEAGVIYCLESFLARWGKDIRFYADEDIGRFRKANPAVLRYPNVCVIAAARCRSLPGRWALGKPKMPPAQYHLSPMCAKTSQ